MTGGYVEFQAAILQALPRDIDPDVALNWTQNGESLSRVLREALVPNGKPKDSYVLSVDYDRSVEDAVKLGQYDWANSDITSKNFPVKGEGTKEVVTELVHFDRMMDSSDEVIRELDKRSLRPATIEELLAFGAKYPELQRQFPILSLGSIWQHLDDRHVPYLGGGGSGRDLYLRWFEGRWDGHFRFLAVRK